MNAKEFLIGAGTMLVGVALGTVICCSINCDKKCDKPMPPAPMEQQYQRPDEPHHEGPKQDGDKCCFMKIAKDLQFSEEQMNQLKALQDEQKEAKKTEREKFESSFQSIMTDEQKVQFEKIKAERKDCKSKCPKGDDKRPKCPKSQE